VCDEVDWMSTIPVRHMLYMKITQSIASKTCWFSLGLLNMHAVFSGGDAGPGLRHGGGVL
jgi:hypothetical protein